MKTENWRARNKRSTKMVRAHEFYCMDCDNEVESYNTYCSSCLATQIEELEERLEFIKEKLGTNMTTNQTLDWQFLYHKTNNKLHQLRWDVMKDIYDQDELNKMARYW